MTNIDKTCHEPYYKSIMASLNISMPDDMREFVNTRTRQGGFSTPTEYMRALIRQDRQRAEQQQFAPIIMKWLSEGQLTPEELDSLPPGFLNRIRNNLEAMISNGLDSGDAGELTRDRLEAMRDRARDKAQISAKRAT
jgi:antitoxin ParD1/3/4